MNLRNPVLTSNDVQYAFKTKEEFKDSELTEEQIVDHMAKTIALADECSTLMGICCEKLKLDPGKTTHDVFVRSFSTLMKKSLEYRKELQEMYISTTVPQQKIKRPRKPKEV